MTIGQMHPSFRPDIFKGALPNYYQCVGSYLKYKKANSQETVKRASIKARATDYLEPKPILPKIDKLHQLLPM